MAGAIITARVTQEQYRNINKLVSDGIFNSRSAVIQTFVELGLEHCSLGKGGWIIKEASAKFKTRVKVATQKATIYTMVRSIINELSIFIEEKSQREIIDCFDTIKCTIARFSPNVYRQFIKLLNKEPIFKVACQVVGKNPLEKEEEEEEYYPEYWY